MNFYSKQVDMLNRRQEGTGEWLFQSDEFKTWLTERKRRCGAPASVSFLLISINTNIIFLN